ncbi:protein of unknown function [Limnospira indica PCC 8005]|uniref:Uncharacterized protein n=1 Tax=Limnospira indica PCC 8005 TaxID=376219 RepID=A0A9P1KCJ5_9CYAN|nr:protein of unknown function [Limnospira indica PCC 8005]
MWEVDYRILSELIDESAQIKAIALSYNNRR